MRCQHLPTLGSQQVLSTESTCYLACFLNLAQGRAGPVLLTESAVYHPSSTRMQVLVVLSVESAASLNFDTCQLMAPQGDFNMGQVAIQVIVVGDPKPLFKRAEKHTSSMLTGIVLDPEVARKHMFVVEGHHVLTFISRIIAPLGQCAERLRSFVGTTLGTDNDVLIDNHMRQYWPGAANVLQIFNRIRARPFVTINRFLCDQFTPMEIMRVAIMRNITGSQSFQGFTKTEAIGTAWRMLGEDPVYPPNRVPFNVNVVGSGINGGPSSLERVVPEDRQEVCHKLTNLDLSAFGRKYSIHAVLVC